jgi:hypothetical protein
MARISQQLDQIFVEIEKGIGNSHVVDSLKSGIDYAYIVEGKNAKLWIDVKSLDSSFLDELIDLKLNNKL